MKPRTRESLLDPVPLPKTIMVSASRAVSYSVTHVSRSVFDISEDTLAGLIEYRPALIVADRAVFSIYRRALQQYAERRLDCKAIVLLEGSENSKSWDQVALICDEAMRCGLRRDGVIVAVGGGVTLDIAGVAASLYRRGVRFVRVPTTLVGMIDVCVGIKHAINFGSKKNVLGSFYPPFGGINDLTFLRTLPRRHVACGVAEIMKMGIIRDDSLVDLIELHGKDLLDSHFQYPTDAAEEVLLRAELAMVRELEPNLFEHDLRRLVDFGHTFSSTLEAHSGYQLAHGEAVAIDMLISCAIAQRRGLCDDSVLARLMDICLMVGLPLSHPACTTNLLLQALAEARIHRAGEVNLVVPLRVGAGAFVQDVDLAEIEGALDLLELCRAKATTELINASYSG